MFLKNEKNLQLNLYNLKSVCFYKISAQGSIVPSMPYSSSFQVEHQSFFPSPTGTLFSECCCHLVDNRNNCSSWLLSSTLSLFLHHCYLFSLLFVPSFLL